MKITDKINSKEKIEYGKACLFFGQPVSKMDKDELFFVIGHVVKQLEEAKEYAAALSKLLPKI